MNIQELIENLGGTSATAQICGVAPAAVSQWIRNERIPKGWLAYFKLAYPELFESQPNPAETPHE